MWPLILNALLALLEKVSFGWWQRWKAEKKAQEIADVPVTDKEWTEDAKRGDL